MAPKTILDYALDYLGQGFSVIPIRPGPEKKPYIAWTQFQKRRPTEEEIYSWWEKWPTANVAIITGSISGIFVIDGDGEIGSRWIAENMPATSVYAKTGRDAGCHCFYRIPPGAQIQNKTSWRPKVDIRGEGGYVIAAPSIHHTGRAYSLIFREGFRGWEELHEFNPFKTVGKGNLNLNLSQVLMPGEEFGPAAKGTRNATLASLLGKMFRAGSTPDEAWAFAETWNSRNQPPMGMREVKTTFRSILKNHIQDAPSDIEIIQTENDDKKQEAFIFGPKTDCYNTEILQPGGLMQEIMTCIERRYAATLPLFSLGAAIALVGNVCGQKIMTETGSRTNMYIFCLGFSGSGKNAGLKSIRHILRASEARTTRGLTEMASAAAVYKHLSIDGKQIALFTLDELGMLLQGLKYPQSPLSTLPKALTTLFSGTDDDEEKGYADEKNNVYVPWHHLSVYGSSTSETFWPALTEGDVTSGFLARAILFESTQDAPFPQTPIEYAIPKAIIEKINGIYSIKTKENPIKKTMGDIQANTPGMVPPLPFIIPRSPEAAEIFLPFAKHYHDLKNSHKTKSIMTSVYGRVAEHAGKLALIHAASLHGSKIIGRQVEAEDIRWGMAVAKASCDKILSGVEDNIACNENHATEQKIIRAIKKRASEKNPGMNSREIKRAVHLPNKQGNEIIDSMLKKGMLFQRVLPQTGLAGEKPPVVIFCVPLEKA